MSASRRILAALLFGTMAPLWMTGHGLAADTKAPGAAPPQAANLSWSEIVDKHTAARGGAQTWKAVHSLQLSGKMDAGRGDSYERAMQIVESGRKYSGKATRGEVASTPAAAQHDDKQVQLPFTLTVERPNRMRLEIEFAGKTAVQVYDGSHGWKVRPFLNRNDVEPYTAEEAKAEASRGDLDGPLIDYAAKGTKVALEGVDKVDGHPAYRLKATLSNGTVQHVWIDTKSFLDVKVEGIPRHMDGKMRKVYVYQRDFRPVHGVMIPFGLETAVDGYPDTHKMIIEKATVNPQLDDALFAKPHA